MTATIILILITLLLGGVVYFLIKKNGELKEDIQDEKNRAAGYKLAIENNKKLSDEAKVIDHNIEVRKNERKKLSKLDKIKLANNRNSDNG